MSGSGQRSGCCPASAMASCRRQALRVGSRLAAHMTASDGGGEAWRGHEWIARGGALCARTNSSRRALASVGSPSASGFSRSSSSLAGVLGTPPPRPAHDDHAEDGGSVHALDPVGFDVVGSACRDGVLRPAS
jgi:hypothetical protein